MAMHPVRRLYTEAYDFPERTGDPQKTMMIAGIPRTGSTYLSVKLWQTGVLGAPMEYINIKNRKDDILVRLGAGDARKYWAALKSRRTSPNGVFSFKAFLGDFSQVASQYPELLSEIKSDLTIYLTRKDKIAQAISYARAFHTGKWFVGAGEKKAPEYNKENIDKALGLDRHRGKIVGSDFSSKRMRAPENLL